MDIFSEIIITLQLVYFYSSVVFLLGLNYIGPYIYSIQLNVG